MYSNLYQSKCLEALQQLLPAKHIQDSSLLQAYVTFLAVQAQPENKNPPCAYPAIAEQLQPYTYALLRDFDKIDRIALLHSDCIRLFNVSLRLFLRFVTPALVADLDSFFHFFKETFSCANTLDFAACATHHLITLKLLAHNVQSELHSHKFTKNNETHTDKLVEQLETGLPFEDALDRLYAKYQKLEKNAAIRLTRKDFATLYRAVNHYPLTSQAEIKISTSSKQVMDLVHILTERLEEPRTRQLEIVADYYINDCQTSEILASYGAPPFCQNPDPQYRKKWLNKAIPLLAKTQPLDILCALSLSKKANPGIPGESPTIARNDIALENGIIYSLFTSALPPKGMIPNALHTHSTLIFYPTPFFVKKWLNDYDLSEQKVTFVLADDATTNILIYHYSEGSYSNTIDDNVSFISYSEWINLPQKTDFPYTKVLLFVATRSRQEQSSWFCEIKARATKAPIEIYALIATKEIEISSSPIATELISGNLTLKSVAIVPQGINNSTKPSRKLFLKSIYDPTRQFVNDDVTQNKTELLSYTLSSDFKVQTLSRVYPQGGPVSIPQNITQLHQSVRKLYHQELLNRRATGREKNVAISYEFTPDITIWCSKSYPKSNRGYPRLEAYLCEPADPKKAARGYMERGLRIKETIKRTTSFSGDGILDWLEYTYPYSYRYDRNYYRDALNAPCIASAQTKPRVSIRETIIAQTAEQFARKNLALKTIWYIYPCLEDWYSGRDKQLLHSMMLSDLGSLYVADTDEDTFVQTIIDCYPEEPAEAIKHRCQILYILLEFARKKEHCTENVLREFVTNEKKRRTALSTIRSNMVIKSLTFDEFITVFNAIITRMQSGKSEYLGVLIRLLTGLESNIVCALRWEDFSQIEDYNIYRLAVTRQVANDGKTLRGFDSLEDYRILPCCKTLAYYILGQQKKTTAEISKFYGGSLVDFPIVISSNNKNSYEDFQSMLSPIVLEKLSKEVLSEAKIEDHVIVIPDSLQGTKETNLSHYSGDFFRENFKYWSQELCKFTPDEVANYVGNKAETTFGRHYCDYLNDSALLVSFVKLQRLDAILANQAQLPASRKTSISARNVEYEFDPKSKSPTHIHITLRIGKGKGKVKIIIKNQLGLRTYVSEFVEE